MPAQTINSLADVVLSAMSIFFYLLIPIVVFSIIKPMIGDVYNEPKSPQKKKEITD